MSRAHRLFRKGGGRSLGEGPWHAVHVAGGTPARRATTIVNADTAVRADGGSSAAHFLWGVVYRNDDRDAPPFMMLRLCRDGVGVPDSPFAMRPPGRKRLLGRLALRGRRQDL